MKIKSVKILGDKFRSLAANKLYEFNTSFREDRLSTKIFAGLNGSGKSNFLELFSEIFYYLEICHLDTVPEKEKLNDSLGFEIEYYISKSKDNIKSLFETDFNNTIEEYINNNLPLTEFTREEFEKKYYREIEELEIYELEKASSELIKDDCILVKISKQLGAKPEYSLIRNDKFNTPRIVVNRTQDVLPSKIIAYSSGQNELLSNPYYKLKYHYFKLFEEKSKLQVNKSLENQRLFFLDYSTNFCIFVANMIFVDNHKLELLKEELKIDEIESFRITINTDEIYKKVIPVSDKIHKNLQKLKSCATIWVEKKVGRHNLLIIDFSITPASKEAFKFHFNNSFELFSVFYEFEIFNLFLVDRKTRTIILNNNNSFSNIDKDGDYNISDEMPKSDPSRLVFRIEKVRISKAIELGKPPKSIFYKSLSDGEHQFNEVIGTVLMIQDENCLFLMDEPDTHFNPMWRAKIIEMLNNVSATSYDKNGKIEHVRKHEIIVTTHSPFIISDSQKEDVYKFSNGDYEKPEMQTYGGSIGMIMETIFERDISISDYSNINLIELKKSVKSLADIQRVKKELLKFGESVEKFDAYSFLQSKEEEFKKNKEE